MPDFFSAATQLGQRAQHFGYHFPGPFDDHAIADANVQIPDVVFVVQSGAFDGDTADLHRLEHGIGRHGSGAANVDNDVEQGRHCFFAGILVGQRPTGILAGEAQFLLQGQRVDFNDQAVDLIGQMVAPFAKRGYIGDQLLKVSVVKLDNIGTNRQTQCVKKGQTLRVSRRRCRTLDQQRLVTPNLERAAR